MELENLAFVLLGCADVERSVAFYRDVLGLPLAARFEDFAFFQTGETQLALSGELGRRAADHSYGAEFVFATKSVVQMRDALAARGVQFISEPRAVNDENWAASFRDPDGHLLSIYGAR
jgi:catechol 2,3-dioxygenase-like lactoylglutathione lyase family enzyme